MKRMAATTIEKRKCGIVFQTQDFKYPAIVEATAMSYKIDYDRALDYIFLSVSGAENYPKIRELISGLGPGDRISLKILRAGEQLEIRSPVLP